jgi:hypothetical protein
MRLNPDARDHLRGAGISQAGWARRFFVDGRWHGDVCGCPDDRCIGYHHGLVSPRVTCAFDGTQMGRGRNRLRNGRGPAAWLTPSTDEKRGLYQLSYYAGT